VVFSSIDFLFVFLPAFLALYFISGRSANIVLLAFSLLFYFIGEGVLLAIMLGSIAANYVFGRLIERSAGRRRGLWTGLGIASNLGLLIHYKYLGFLAVEVLGLDDPGYAGSITLPLGISFFTFQAISYLVDVHRRDAAAETSLLRLGLYIAMFPQLIAGPIVRFASVAEALRGRTVTGLHLYQAYAFFAVGLAAKVLIADGVAPLADAVFAADPASLRADAAAVGVLAYTLQIYFDFLGYSSMAVGLGYLLGFDFPRNFDFPYIAQSVTEFWRRWHISLSTWFRDYVYIPLGGNRISPWRTYLNLSIVFLLTGLWHGAAWTFVVWGMWHGALLVAERLGLSAVLARAPVAVRHAYVLLAVMGGWVLFRSADLAQAGGMIAALGRWDAPVIAATHLTNEALLTLIAGVALSMPLAARMLDRWVAMPRYAPWTGKPGGGRIAAGLVLFGLLLAASGVKVMSGSYSPFLYFRF
jgi:alginate O-acetyltransferase complex protein AlgI